MLKINNTSLAARHLAASIMQSGMVCAFDLDGVLLDATARQLTKSDGSLDLEHYRENSTGEKIALDKSLALLEAVHILNDNNVPYHVITARVACRHTLALLEDRNIKPLHIMARSGEHDNRKDHDLKTTHLLANFDQRQRENMVLVDDNVANCKAVKTIGLKAINVQFEGH
jgi:phosphoglycolate phosphatase-like HAD superfamily hydrolase